MKKVVGICLFEESKRSFFFCPRALLNTAPPPVVYQGNPQSIYPSSSLSAGSSSLRGEKNKIKNRSPSPRFTFSLSSSLARIFTAHAISPSDRRPPHTLRSRSYSYCGCTTGT